MKKKGEIDFSMIEQSLDLELKKLLELGLNDPVAWVQTLVKDVLEAMESHELVKAKDRDLLRVVLLSVVSVALKADRILKGRLLVGDAAMFEKLKDGNFEDVYPDSEGGMN